MVAAAFGKTTTTTTEVIPKPTPSTIIDILSSQAQYSYFLRHLQRQGMVPLLNSVENVTLLAPINSAFIEESVDIDSNILLRYIINQKMRVGWLGRDEVVYSTLFPLNNGENYTVSVSPDFEAREYVVDKVSAIVEADIYAKHQHSFIQGIERLLPIKPELCEVLMSGDSTVIDGRDITFIKRLFQLVFSMESCKQYLADTKTLFIPSDDLINQKLSELHRQYYLALYESLTSPRFATTNEARKEFTNDIHNLLSFLRLPDFVAGINGTNLTYRGHHGNEYQIYLKHHKLTVNELKSVGNIVLSNGVIHVFDESSSEDMNHSFFEALNITLVDLIPRKVLHGLHFSKFAKELSFRNLEYLIDGSTSSQSLFLDINDRDDVSDDEDIVVNAKTATNSFSSKQRLLYQFGNSLNITKEMENKNEVFTLVQSKLCSKKRIGGCFNLKLASTNTRGNTLSTLNDGLQVIEGPIDMGKSSFLYVVNGDIAPPVSFKHALGEVMSSGSIPRHTEHFAVDKQSCLTTLDLLNQFKLFSLEDNGRGYTVFLPCGMGKQQDDKSNWQELGLISTYLYANPEKLEDLVKGLFIQDVIYTDKEKAHISTNLNGEEVKVKSTFGQHDHIIRLNETEISVPVNSDIIFNQGVIHLTDKVLFPDNFEVPFLDLIKTTLDSKFPNHSMLELLDLYPKIKEALGLTEKVVTSPFSLLIPSPDSLNNFNITTDFAKLLDFIEFHLIPNDQLGKMLTCVGLDGYDQNVTTIQTNLTSTSLTCYQSKSGHRFLHLVEPNAVTAKPSKFDTLSYNKDREVKIVNYGCTRNHQRKHPLNDLQCVFLIEKPLSLQWLKPNNDNLLHVHLGLVSLGLGIIFGLIIFAGIMFLIVVCLGKDSKKNTTKSTFPDDFAPRNDNHFMKVRLNNDDLQPHDRGYETDIDILRDNDEFLPLYGTKKIYKKRDYGSTRDPENTSPTTNAVPVPTPRNARGIAKTLTRNRNLPDVS
jgi:uncharacterized surface protein with fasciclin (FAS1) repeats